MNIKILVITILFFGVFIISEGIAGIYECSIDKSIFTDINQCNQNCMIGCSELDIKSENSGICSDKYTGYFFYNGNTYAFSKETTEFDDKNGARVYDERLNSIIKNLMSAVGISKAWIGLYDKDMSTEYDVINKDRFIWVDGSKTSYSNFKKGEPNNILNPLSIGVSSVYGEHWVAINSDGSWEDLGYNPDGSKTVLNNVVEFRGALSCVSGKPKPTVSDSSKNLCPDGGTDCMMCASDESLSTGVISFSKCEYGIVFNTNNYDYLCGVNKIACDNNPEYKLEEFEEVIFTSLPDITKSDRSYRDNYPGTFIKNYNSGVVSIVTRWYGGIANQSKKSDEYVRDLSFQFIQKEGFQYISSTVEVLPYLDSNGSPVNWCYGNKIGNHQECKIEGRWINSEVPIKYTYRYKAYKVYDKYTCRNSNRPCIKSSDGNYYCSSKDCANTGNASNFIPNDTEQGSNDSNNNGEINDKGECLGKIIVFDGEDNRCRRVSNIRGFYNCCVSKSVEETQDGSLHMQSCNGSEKSLMVKRYESKCIEVGEYCSEEWSGSGCVQKKNTYCCYQDDFQKAFIQAGKEMLGRDFGHPLSPDCKGFTPEELQKLGAMGIQHHPAMRAYADKFGAENKDKILNDFNNNLSNEIPKLIDGIPTTGAQ